MSDSRFHLRATFEVYGREVKLETSLNWSAAPGECDERIAGWFATSYETAYAEFQEAQFLAKTERRKKAGEAAERMKTPAAEIDRIRTALTEIRDRIKGHSAYETLTEEEEEDIGGDAAESSYLARVADEALGPNVLLNRLRQASS